jgi:hypothetical protein
METQVLDLRERRNLGSRKPRTAMAERGCKVVGNGVKPL